MAILSAPRHTRDTYDWKNASVTKLEYKLAPEENGIRKTEFLTGLTFTLLLTFLLGLFLSVDQDKKGADLKLVIHNQKEQIKKLESTIAQLEGRTKVHQKAYQELSDALLKTNLLMEKLGKNWDAERLAQITELDERLAYLETHQRSKEQIEKELMRYKQYETLRKPPLY